MTDDLGYVDYREVLILPELYKPADVIRNYKKRAKQLLIEISEDKKAAEKQDQYLLQMAQLNAAFYILRDRQRGETYLRERDEVMGLEREWRDLTEKGATGEEDTLRRRYDQALRNFLAKYMEEFVLEAGRDPECVENSNWSSVHERLAGRILRQYRQQRYQEIHERRPFFEISQPEVDWEERGRFAEELLKGSRQA